MTRFNRNDLALSKTGPSIAHVWNVYVDMQGRDCIMFRNGRGGLASDYHLIAELTPAQHYAACVELAKEISHG